MTCPKCRRDGMTTKTADHPYTGSGLTHLTLVGVEVRTCASCGESVVIPHIDGLHRTIAAVTALRRGRFTAHEIRFLRTWLDWTVEELASLMAVETVTVERWEKRERPQPMSALAERFLRVLVVMHLSADLFARYAAKLRALEIDAEGELRPLRLKFVASNWRRWLGTYDGGSPIDDEPQA